MYVCMYVCMYIYIYNNCFINFLKLQKFEVRKTSEKSEKIRAKSKKLDEDAMLGNTMWSDRRRFITKNISFSRTFKRQHWSKLSTEKFSFSFLALFREKFRFPAKTFLALQRLAQSFTILGQTKVYELITKIEWTNQSKRNALSEVENLINIFIFFSSIWAVRNPKSLNLIG